MANEPFFTSISWLTFASNILGQAPLTEELVFRACMIPILLSGGFKPITVIFLCPILFSLGKFNASHFSKWNHPTILHKSLCMYPHLFLTGHDLMLPYTFFFLKFVTFPLIHRNRENIARVWAWDFLFLCHVKRPPDLYIYTNIVCVCVYIWKYVWNEVMSLQYLDLVLVVY